MTAPTSDDAANSNVIRLVDDQETAMATLAEAVLCNFKTVMVIGYDADDEMTVLTSHDVLNKDALWMLEQAKLELIRNAS